MKLNPLRSAAFFIAFLSLITLNPLSLVAATVNSASLDASAGSGATPLYIYIPSIKLFTNVQGVGVNEKGNMDVPSGKTNNVGWYQYGVVPGNPGTAVLDAHNTAAFKELNKVPVGSDIYVFTSEGKWLHFTATNAVTYSMDTLSSSTLFAPANTPQLNLITCAGQSLGNGEATHRLIVSAKLAA